MSFTTADGGYITFGQMVRSDRVALTDAAKELNVQDERLQVGPEPYLVGHKAQPLLPKRKMWFQLAHHPR